MKRMNLNEGWLFRKLPGLAEAEVDCADALPADSFEPVSLPHTWYEDGAPYRGLALYRRRVAVEPGWHRVFLSLENADRRCRVFVNGLPAGTHEGGYSRFRVEAPQSALASGELVFSVYVDNRPQEDALPNFGDFTVFGGLTRGAELIACGGEHFDYAYYGTDGLIVRTELGADGGVVHAEPHAVAREGAVIRYIVEDAEGCVVAEAEGGANERADIAVPGAKAWDGVGGARLYTVRAVLTAGGEVVDEARVRTGFRTVEVSPDTGLFLNGRHVKLHGVAKHQDRAEVYSAASEAQIREDFDIIREMGANAVRLSHYQHPRAAYDLCDETGLLAWAEIPMLKMTQSPRLMESARQQLKELILQNIHHPSIFCWGIQNEIGIFGDAPFMAEGCRELRAEAKALDPGRLTACANLYTVRPKSALNGITDVVGYNIYFGWYYGEMADYASYLDRFHALRPEVALGVSEYGVDASPRLHAEAPAVKDYSEEYQALFHETVYPIFAARDYLWGSFVWNMFDFHSEVRSEGDVPRMNAKGLVTHDRKLRKDAWHYYRAVWSEEPCLHICGRRFVKRAREKIDIKLYTNLPEAELIVNGARLGPEKNGGSGVIVFRDVPLSMGRNEIEARGGALTDACAFERVIEEEASYRLPADPDGGKVKNWFLSEDDGTREGYFSLSDTADELLGCAESREILQKALPQLFRLLTESGKIPLGLSLKSILSRDAKPEDAEKFKVLNAALNEIKNPNL